MAELVPIPLGLLVQRAFYEHRQERKIFDLPEAKFFRGFPDLDLSVEFHGHRASTPLGPAAGPHGQLAQNIALSWLGGSRIIELKTVQILDELKIPRPCIDVANVGYNVEWSQELTLEQSLNEYVKAAMLVEILKASGLAGEDVPSDTVFDMSVGYNLEGLRSPKVRGWIQSMKTAGPIVDGLRQELTGEWAKYRDLPFPTSISDTISLSTFHGCPAGEIEGIVTFLLEEMGCHVCIKFNPTLLGRERVAHLLHDVLGYREIQLHEPAFENDLKWDESLHLIPRLQRVAAAAGRGLSVKFSNTLVVKNHKGVFTDDLMYMSGPPLHVLALDLAARFRTAFTGAIPVSFSGGIDSRNFARAVAMNFVPVTTCTDLLRTGGYARLWRYLENLGAEMRDLGVTQISDFVLKYRGEHTDIETAGKLNSTILAAEAAADPRYGWEKNKGVPRKIGSKLWIFDCIDCDKCVPVCPNDANFVYDIPAQTIEYENFQLEGQSAKRLPGGVLRVVKKHQFANYADACNDCGNCEIFCPEDGGPQLKKPRFFSTADALRQDARGDGFYIDWQLNSIEGHIDGRQYELKLDTSKDRGQFKTDGCEVELRLSDGEPLAWPAGETRVVEMLPYWKLKLLIESIGDPRHVNFANAAAVKEKDVVNG